MKKFILINSPIFWEASTDVDDYLSPLGQGYIATQLEKNGFEVELLDAVKNRMSVDDILKYIEEKRPQYIGVNIFTQNYGLVKYIVENALFSGSVFIGGQSVKFMYDEILMWNCENECNIISGEGEYIIPAICNDLCMEKPIIIKENKKVYVVDKESVYFPENISSENLNRRFLSNELITNHYGEKEAAIITSRGCLYDCAFCGGARSLNKDVVPRIRDQNSIITEIDEIINYYPEVSSIRVLDDLFLRNRASFELAIHVFERYNNLHWRGMAHVLSLKSAKDKLADLKKSGCRELFVGIESGSPRIRKYINKLGNREDILNVARYVLEHGIDLKGYFIYGFPEETEADFYQTFELASEIRNISFNANGNFRTSVFQFRPYHGTRLYNELVEKYGESQECSPNLNISKEIGRSQFNFKSGNYSAADEDTLYRYILNTQNLCKGDA